MKPSTSGITFICNNFAFPHKNPVETFKKTTNNTLVQHPVKCNFKKRNKEPCTFKIEIDNRTTLHTNKQTNVILVYQLIITSYQLKVHDVVRIPTFSF